MDSVFSVTYEITEHNKWHLGFNEVHKICLYLLYRSWEKNLMKQMITRNIMGHRTHHSFLDNCKQVASLFYEGLTACVMDEHKENSAEWYRKCCL